MTAFQFSTQNLESRDIAADTSALEGRIDAYRDRHPDENPNLIVELDNSVAVTGGEIPQVDPSELSVNLLRESLTEHGALNVRGLFPREVIEAIPAAIDHVLDVMEAPRKIKRSTVSPYYNPASNMAAVMPGDQEELNHLRVFNHRVGAVMCAEAPCVAEYLLELYEQYGIKSLVSQYLNEAPCLSVKKWVLRRSTLPVSESGWHQDGAFMGDAINSINLWLPLTDCGGETGAPGMDIVPARLHGIVSAEGASFDWSVSDSLINNQFGDARPVAPVFHAGDAFFFDHLYLHRTQFREDFTKRRYAVETWFFGESAFPKGQAPLAW